MVRCAAIGKSSVSIGRWLAVAGGVVGLFLLSSSVAQSALAEGAIAATVNKQQSLDGDRNDRLPPQVAAKVQRDLAQRLDRPQQDLSVISYSRQTWSDSCLGLGTAAELCAQALVPGWQVELTDGEQRWVYRTDAAGQTMRLQSPIAEAEADNLPEQVSDRVLEAAADDSGTPESELAVVAARQQTWDGCLGIASADACTQIAISGWQVIVAGATGSWVYHSDAEGSDIRLNETASLPESMVTPDFIPADQLSPEAETGVVFKAIVTGGITGSSSQILLLEDGQVVQFADDQGVSTATELNQLDPEQVQALIELLRKQRFSNLSGLSYAAPAGAADYRTVTLIGQGSTVRYADIVQDQLPSALQQVIQAWEQTISES